MSFLDHDTEVDEYVTAYLFEAELFRWLREEASEEIDHTTQGPVEIPPEVDKALGSIARQWAEFHPELPDGARGWLWDQLIHAWIVLRKLDDPPWW